MEKWQRRQNYRHKPFWVWQEYEIHKIWAEGTTTYDMFHIDFHLEPTTYNTLFEAKFAAEKRRKDLKCL
jgi:hypothetical protein